MNRYDDLIKRLTDWGDLPLEKQEPIPLSEDQLVAVEREFGHSLPDDYREFLSSYGGFAVLKYFRIPEPKRPNVCTGEIDTFCGVIPPHSYDLLQLNRRKRLNLLADFIIIGLAESSFTLMKIVGERRGAIYFYDRSQTSLQDESENIHFVANSFDEFMQLLNQPFDLLDQTYE